MDGLQWCSVLWGCGLQSGTAGTGLTVQLDIFLILQPVESLGLLCVLSTARCTLWQSDSCTCEALLAEGWK